MILSEKMPPPRHEHVTDLVRSDFTPELGRNGPYSPTYIYCYKYIFDIYFVLIVIHSFLPPPPYNIVTNIIISCLHNLHASSPYNINL